MHLKKSESGQVVLSLSKEEAESVIMSYYSEESSAEDMEMLVELLKHSVDKGDNS